MYPQNRPVAPVRPGSRSFLATLLLLALTAGVHLHAYAQQLTGSLSGTAFDISEAVIPNAEVVLMNAASGDIRKTTTDSKGFFSLSAVQPGAYTITVSAKGFRSWREDGIVMNEGDARSVVNIKLAIGTSEQEVTVVANQDVVVPLDNGEISTTINEQMIQDITLQGRDAGELLTLMPGMGMNGGLNNKAAFTDTTVGSNNGPVGSFSSNGTQPNGAMAFLLDGANLVDPGNAGTQIANINQDMVSEVKILQSDYGAEYAKGPTIFEAFSKSGGLKFHGEAYLIARNSALNSFESYAKSQYVGAKNAGTLTPTSYQTLNPDSHYYYMGGNVGGPVILPFTRFNRNNKKLFFWVGYEYMNQDPASTPVNFNVPTAAQLQGDFSNTGVNQSTISQWSSAYSYINGNTAQPTDIPNATNQPCPNAPTKQCVLQIPMADFDSNTKALLAAKLYPAPNLTPDKYNSWSNYQYPDAVPQNRWEATGKLDYALNDNTKVTASYTRQIENDQHPLAIWWAAPWTLPYPGGVSAATVSQEVMINATHSFSATTTNEFVYALARYINPNVEQNAAASDRTNIGFNVPGLFGHTTKQIPNIEGPWGGSFANISNESFDGAFDGGAFGGLKKAPALYDNFTKVLGTHTLKVGAYWDTQENQQSSTNSDNGTFNFGGGGLTTGNSYADFFLARPQNYQQSSAVPVDDVKYHQYSLYVQDSWRANKGLTANVGVRFDHIGQWYGVPLGIQVWDPATYSNASSAVNPGLDWHAKDSGVPLSGFNSPLFYAEPRVSFAYDLSGNGKTVVRGGLALFRYQISTEVCGNNACDGPAGTFTYTTPTTIVGGYTGITAQAAPSSGGVENGASIGVLQKGDNRTPYTWDWNLTLSRALPWHSVAEASYVANVSRDEFINGANGKYDDLNNTAIGAYFKPDPITGLQGSPTQNGFNTQDYRPLQNYQDVYLMTHGSIANYNSLQVSWQKQSGPVNFLTNYTFAKVLGIRDGDSSNGNGNGSMVDPFNLANNYGPLAYDHTQMLNLVYIWKMPNWAHGNRLLGTAINGWELSGVTQFQSGAPLQPNLAGNFNAQYPGNLPTSSQFLLPNGTMANAISPSTWFGTNSINVLVPALSCDPRKNKIAGAYFNPKCFTIPAYGQQGTLKMPYMRGPAFFDSDLALFKKFPITEGQRIEFRLSARNFLNHPLPQFGLSGNSDEQLNFVNSDQTLSQTNVNTSTTGKPLLTTGQRLLTLSAKYFF
jgi:hypothetical protein